MKNMDRSETEGLPLREPQNNTYQPQRKSYIVPYRFLQLCRMFFRNVAMILRMIFEHILTSL